MPKVIIGPLKVLLLIHNANVTGPGRIVYGLAKYFDRKEFLLDVLCPKDGYLSDELRKIGIRVIPLESKNLWSLKFILKVYNTLKKETYHVFHVHSGQLNAFSKIIGKVLGIPVIVFTEHLNAESHVWMKGKFKIFIHLLFHRLSNIMVDKIIAVSNTTKDSFIKRQKIEPKKIVTIYNGIDIQELKSQDTDTSKTKEKWGIPQNIPIVGMVARLRIEKGHRTLVFAAREVLRKIPDVRFLIVGEGTERHDIEDLIEKLGIKESFILAGLQKNIYEFIDIMDFAVQSSLAEGESFGLSIVEAMAKSKAIIVSDIGCFREIIKDNENGLLFPVGNHFMLAEKIALLLNDIELRKRLGASAQKTAENNFDIRIMVRKTRDLYKDILVSKRFYLRDDYLRKVITIFIESIKKERSLPLKKISVSCDSIEKYLLFIKDKKLKHHEVREYFAQEDNYLLEIFLEFLYKNKVSMDKICSYNNRLFKKILKEQVITSKDYDKRIRMRPLQFQIDNYCNPKDQAQRARIDIILSTLQPREGESILDVGCGVGTFAYHCAKKGARAVGVDYSPESIDVAKQLAEHFGISESVEFVCCDAASLPYPDMSFDKVIAADFIEHIDDNQKRETLLEMLRVLKPGGFIVIFTPNGLREWLGLIKTKLRRITGLYQPETRLHYGLTNRFKFERMLKGRDLIFNRRFFDVNRPFLAKIPVFKEVLSLNILWIIKNRG